MDKISQPFFPPELEEIIVEIAALDGIQFPLTSENCCLDLQLTARRFRDWTVPYLYRVLHTDRFFLNREESECIGILRKCGRRTSHIYVGINQSNAIKVLEHCPNVEDIVNWHGNVVLKDLHPSLQHASNLQRLSAFFEMLPTELVLSPVYLNITHLDVMDSMDWDLLVKFPNISHLCFTDAPIGMSSLLARLTHKDSGCKSLRVIICLYQTWYQCADERFVKLILPNTHQDHEADWLRGSNGGMDFWEFAERIATARKAGYLTTSSTDAVYQPPPQFNIVTKLTDQGQLWWSQMR